MMSRFLVSYLTGLTLIFGWQFEAPAEMQEPVVVSPRNFSSGRIGSCLDNGVFYDLSKALNISNTDIEILELGDRARAKIEGESIVLTKAISGRFSSEIIDIGHIVSPNEDIDISLSFVLLDEKVSLYWRESYLNRRYRQGIFRIDGAEGIVSVCEGVGGGGSKFITVS